jgi:aarF domain-containing kinase
MQIFTNCLRECRDTCSSPVLFIINAIASMRFVAGMAGILILHASVASAGFAHHKSNFSTSAISKSSQLNAAIVVSEKAEGENDLSLLLVRTAEIAGVAFDLAVPLATSALFGSFHKNTKTASQHTVTGTIDTGTGTTFSALVKPEQDGWEMFWSANSKWKSTKISNADRVVNALESLGPTYVKFGQALSSRPDIIPKSLAESLCALQDNMAAFDTDVAKLIIETELKNAGVEEIRIAILLDSLSPAPVAAASVGQVYKGYLLDVGEVAIKVQRPGIRRMVEKDAALLRSLASFVESIPSPSSSGRLVNTEVKSAVDEFMSRIFEELDYTNEAANAIKFANLYSNKYGSARESLPGKGVVVPEIMSDYCTDNVIVMEWITGSKLTSIGENSDNKGLTPDPDKKMNDLKERKENLALVEQALYITLSQLLEYGTMHADPHGGNLLKVRDTRKGNSAKNPKSTLAYLDFGLLATIPEQVRDGLVCAVSQLVFAKDVEAVASLFGELNLMPLEIVNDPYERAALTQALTKTMEEVLVYPEGEDILTPTNRASENTNIPTLKFDKLLDGLVRLVPRFKFQLPPYFINNARALGTLEGTARSLDPNFNAFALMYPYALNRILQNPTNSPVVADTLQKMVRNSETGKIDREKIRRLLRDSALYTGYSKRRVLKDILKTKGGKDLAKEIVRQGASTYASRIRGLWQRRSGGISNFLRL